MVTSLKINYQLSYMPPYNEDGSQQDMQNKIQSAHSGKSSEIKRTREYAQEKINHSNPAFDFITGAPRGQSSIQMGEEGEKQMPLNPSTMPGQNVQVQINVEKNKKKKKSPRFLLQHSSRKTDI